MSAEGNSLNSLSAIASNETSANVGVGLTLSSRLCLEGVTAYINAGGRGTRLNSIFAPDPLIGVSKALLGVGRPAIPIIEHQVNKLLRAGMPGVLVGAGDHAQVADHIRSRYAAIPAVRSVYSPVQLGNGGDLVRTVREYPELFEGNVSISNCDTILDVDEAAILAFHREREADVTIALTTKPGVPNEEAFYLDGSGKVLHCLEVDKAQPRRHVRQATALRASSTGMLVMNTSMLRSLEWQPEDGPLSLYRDIMSHALATGEVYGFNNGERYFTDVGTVNTWYEVQDAPHEVESYLVRET